MVWYNYRVFELFVCIWKSDSIFSSQKGNDKNYTHSWDSETILIIIFCFIYFMVGPVWLDWFIHSPWFLSGIKYDEFVVSPIFFLTETVFLKRRDSPIWSKMKIIFPSLQIILLSYLLLHTTNSYLSMRINLMSGLS